MSRLSAPRRPTKSRARRGTTAKPRAPGCCTAGCGCLPSRATPRPRRASWPRLRASTSPRSATTSATRPGCTARCSSSRLGSPQDDIARYGGPELSLPQALAGLYAGFLEPLKQGDTARLCMKLHFREMLEPTGLWDEEIAHGIKPMHDALLAVLCRHFGLAEPDDELQRLAVCIAGLGVHLHVGRDVIDAARAAARTTRRCARPLVRPAGDVRAGDGRRRARARRDAAGATDDAPRRNRWAWPPRPPAARRLLGLGAAGGHARQDPAAAGAPPAWQAPPPPADRAGRPARWWQQFDDPVLLRDGRRGAGGQPDARLGRSRIEQARASSVAAGALLLPAVDAKPRRSAGRTDLATPSAS